MMDGPDLRVNGSQTGKRLCDFLAKRDIDAYNGAALQMSDDPLRDLSQISGLGFVLVSYVLVFTGGGYLLDRWLGTDPWLMVGGVFVGAALGFIYMIRMLTSANRAERDADDEDDG